jgi:hypothetical protein
MNDAIPLLTVAQIQVWAARRIEIANTLATLEAEDAVLQRKLEAAKVFVDEAMKNDMANQPHDEDGLAADPNAPSMEAAEESISHGVLAAVAAMKGAPKAVAIRKWIVTNNPDVAKKLEAHPGYLYTTLMRHVRGRRLAKRGKGYRLPINSPKGETGRAATPPGLNGHTVNDTRAASEKAPEAGGI